MNFLGKIAKYFLWILFSLVCGVLLIGWAKMDWNLGSYVSFLNMNNWSVFDFSQPSTWTAPFWASAENSGSLADMLTGEVIETGISGLDVYDPSFEEELNAMGEDSLSGATDEYGFSTEPESSVETGVVSDGAQATGLTSKSALYNLIKNTEKK